MSEPDIDCGFPLDRFIRRHPRVADALMVALFTLPLTARCALLLWDRFTL